MHKKSGDHKTGDVADVWYEADDAVESEPDIGSRNAKAVVQQGCEHIKPGQCGIRVLGGGVFQKNNRYVIIVTAQNTELSLLAVLSNSDLCLQA